MTAARAVYEASTERYVGFVGTEIRAATEGPIDRSLPMAFVELVATGGGAQVADVGCGPGRVAAYLSAYGLDVIGVDVSPAMLVEARRAHPDIEFEEGRLDDFPIAVGALAGSVCWYSIIYTPPGCLDDAFAELRRVLEPGGHLLLAFRAGDGEATHRTAPTRMEPGLRSPFIGTDLGRMTRWQRKTTTQTSSGVPASPVPTSPEPRFATATCDT